jgi:hypothetical protein
LVLPLILVVLLLLLLRMTMVRMRHVSATTTTYKAVTAEADCFAELGAMICDTWIAISGAHIRNQSQRVIHRRNLISTDQETVDLKILSTLQRRENR